MAILSSILRANFRRNFMVIYLLSSALPILLMILIILRYIVPQLSESQLYALNPMFGLGVLVMLIPSILGIGLGYHWIGSIEKLANEIRKDQGRNTATQQGSKRVGSHSRTV